MLLANSSRPFFFVVVVVVVFLLFLHVNDFPILIDTIIPLCIASKQTQEYASNVIFIPIY